MSETNQTQAHFEHETQNSLTAPADRTSSTFALTKGVTLTEDQVKSAFDDLVIKDGVKTYPRIEKYYADPEISGQKFCLFSFVPAKGATPDKDGVYGIGKFRGAFMTQREADDKAEELIRGVDSYHSIYHYMVGRPFPITFNRRFVQHTNDVELVQKTVQTISEDIKSKREKDKKEIAEIKEREQKLLEASKEEKQDPFEEYTTLQVKKAQLAWTYAETQKKMDQMKASIIATRKMLAETEATNPEFKDNYMQKYKDARKEAGLPETDDSFMKYMGEDIDIGF